MGALFIEGVIYINKHSLAEAIASHIHRSELWRVMSGLEVIKLEFILRLKIKHNDWLLADTCPQAANHCALF